MADGIEGLMNQNRTSTPIPPEGSLWKSPDTNTGKPWYNDATWAGALKGSVDGIFGYLNMQERLRGEKSLMADHNAYQTGAVNAAVQRASTMPTLKRMTKKKVRV